MPPVDSDPRFLAGPGSIFYTTVPILLQAVALVLRLLALGWVCGRFYRIIRHPTVELRDHLNSKECNKLDVVVEQVGDTWASIYWSHTQTQRPRRSKVRKYVITCGTQQLVLDRNQKKAVVRNLEPGKPHKIVVYAVISDEESVDAASPAIEPGSASFVSTADSGFVTPSVTSTASAAPFDANLSTVDQESAISDNLPSKSIPSSLMEAVSTSVFVQTLQQHATDSPPPMYQMLRAPPLASVHSSTQHSANANAMEIFAIQQEIRDIIAQQEAADLHFSSKNSALISELADLAEQRRQDELKRTQLRVENHNLENDLHALELQAAKLKIQTAQIAKYSAESQAEINQVRNLEMQLAARKTENERMQAELEEELRELQQYESYLITQVRENTLQYKYAVTRTQNIRDLVCALEGTHSPEDRLQIIHNMADARAIEDDGDTQTADGDADLMAQLAHELRLDATIEREWKRAQDSLEKQYIDAYLTRNDTSAASGKVIPRSGSTTSLTSAPSVTASGPTSIAANSLTPVSSADKINGPMSIFPSSFSAPFAAPPSSSFGATPFTHSIHSPSSLASLQSSKSISSKQGISGIQYDPFCASSSSVPQADHSSDPTELLPADLIPNMDMNDNTSINTYSSADATSATSNIAKEDDAATPKHRHDWLPWIGHKTSNSTHRTQSLFFHGDHPEEEVFEETDDINTSPTNREHASYVSRSPRRSVGSFFQKSSGRSSSFASRFGFFSKGKPDDEKDKVEKPSEQHAFAS